MTRMNENEAKVEVDKFRISNEHLGDGVMEVHKGGPVRRGEAAGPVGKLVVMAPVLHVDLSFQG